MFMIQLIFQTLHNTLHYHLEKLPHSKVTRFKERLFA